MSDSKTIATLPIVNVQHDFQTVIADVQDGLDPEDFWVSCYKTGSASVHGKVRVTKEDGEVHLASRQGVEFIRGQRSLHTAACPDLSIPPTRIRVPRRVLRDAELSDPARPHQINAFDVSPDTKQIAVGYNDGSIQRRVIPPNGGDTTRVAVTYRPHVASVTSLRFFPSSKVLLSAGADFALAILDADPDSTSNSATTNPVRTLKAHSRAITDTAIVSRGRNVLSCAKDGTIRLWDVSGGKQIKVMGSSRYSPITKMSIGAKSSEWTIPSASGDNQSSPFFDQREVDTGDKLLFCALQDGTFEVFDLGTKAAVFHSEKGENESGALTSISYSSSHNLLSTGSIRGIVSVYDTRRLATPLATFSRNGSSIEDLAFVSADSPTVGIAIASEDGLPYTAGLAADGPRVDAELIGADCEAVRVIRVDPTGGIWTAGDDGLVRAY
ncbi:WD40 repeat-like protein [Schizopora paradoxa]|uniref:WD40 repeat-like protein n=1 Tax=Schizopora paradoxa TaxID=27342 RepID=A0A0H2RP56_9AGAM|nr:WD40 repeat-like protein [Schizopora paradoxa]